MDVGRRNSRTSFLRLASTKRGSTFYGLPYFLRGLAASAIKLYLVRPLWPIRCPAPPALMGPGA